MVNGMSGLKVIKGTNNKLVMINHKAPAGLFGKLDKDVSYDVEDLDSGISVMTFKSISGTGTESDLNQTACH
jgi:hypothetical protein